MSTSPTASGIAEQEYMKIEPTKGWVSLKLDELWDYRELLYFMIWRDIKVRYKQTVLGVAWAVIQPVMTMLVFSIFFGRLAKISSDGLPYPLFSYAALVPWGFFAGGLGKASDSLVGSAQLIKKIYFPRLAIPIAGVLSGLVDFAISFSVVLVLMVIYGVYPTLNIVFLPLFLLLSLITSLGVGLWLAAMNVQYRDVRYLIPFITQIWMFASPIVYPSSYLAEPWRSVYGINPMAGVVEGFRWALLGSGSPPGAIVFVSAAASILVLIGGAFYFRRMERNFADVV